MNKLKPGILSTYVFRSFVPPFAVGIIFFSFVVLLFNMKEAIKAAIEKSIDVIYILKLVVYSLGWTLSLTIPMSALLGIIMAISTLNNDSEIIAMRAGGITYTRIFRPFLVFGTGMVVLLLWFHQSIVPFCMREMKIIAYQIYKYNPTSVIEEGQFSLLEEGSNSQRHIFVEKIGLDLEAGNRTILKNVQIKKSEKISGHYSISEFIIAEKGYKIQKELENGEWVKAIRLYNGFIFLIDHASGVHQTINFHDGHLDINIREKRASFDLKRKTGMNSMSYSDLVDEIDLESKNKEAVDEQRLIKLKTEYHKRVSLSFATFFFLYLGFPMGIINKRSGKGLGLGQSIIFIFVYFALFLSSDAVAVNLPMIPPVLSAWSANIAILVFALTFNLLKTIEVNWKKVLSDLVHRKSFKNSDS